MSKRLNYKKYQDRLKGLLDTHKLLEDSTLEASLQNLVEVRASQINGCAFCVDMHTKVARSQGETEQRLYALALWHETPFFTKREQVALKWTEAITLIAQNEISDELYGEALEEFGEEGLMDLTMCISLINSFNRLAKPFRAVPGSYRLKEKV